MSGSEPAERTPDVWIVDAKDAVQSWLATNPPASWATPVVEWVNGVAIMGPPADASPVPGDSDRYIAKIPATRAVVEYLAIGQTRTVIVKEIR